MKHIYLIGFMGCGKSTVSSYLSKNCGYQLIEMDEQIEKEQKMSISEIFAKNGEEYFRGLETALIRNLNGISDKTVVSCGGGVPMRQENVEAMRKNGKIIWLDVSPETVYERVRYSQNRPLLEGNMNVEYITGLLEKRIPKYRAAADEIIRVDGKKPEEIAEEILCIS
ncbi:MAG: shikimate kinase [Eubacteriales bacterium]|nr:shikimate kinase [Eubacteriales bacterium]